MGKLERAIKLLNFGAVIIGIFFIGLTIYSRLIINYQSSVFFWAEPINKQIEHLPPLSPEQSVSFLFFGDIMLDRSVQNKIEKNGLDFLLEPLNKEHFFITYNLISANLEGAVTNNGEHYQPILSNDFAFKPEDVERLKNNYYFNFFSLANNHFSDQGARGIMETKENLDKVNLNYSGCPDGEAGDCSSKIIEIAGKKIGLVGFSMVYHVPDEEKMKKIVNDLASSTDFTIVNTHWGVEYEHQFNITQQRIAHELIDAGADVIIGHHPHVVQGLEIFHGKPIFYSLGNFIFDQYFSEDTQEGLAISLTLGDNREQINLFPMLSRASQVELMNNEQKEKFLEKLAGWSELNDEYKKQLVGSTLAISR